MYTSSPGRRGYCYAELAVFFPSSGRNHHQYSLHLPTEGWPGWVGLGGRLRSEIIYLPAITKQVSLKVLLHGAYRTIWDQHQTARNPNNSGWLSSATNRHRIWDQIHTTLTHAWLFVSFCHIIPTRLQRQTRRLFLMCLLPPHLQTNWSWTNQNSQKWHRRHHHEPTAFWLLQNIHILTAAKQTHSDRC